MIGLGIALLGSLLVMPASAFAWKEIKVSSPTVGAEYIELRSVACFNLESSTKALCWAVGNYKETSGGTSKTLVEKYTSSTNKWEVETSPDPSTKYNALYAIACQTETECVAVGAYDNASGESLPLGVRMSSGSWTLDNPTAPTGTLDELTGVSCPPKTGECMAVGDYHNSKTDVPLAYRWSTGTWGGILSPLAPAGSTAASVGADSCPTAECIAGNSNRNKAFENEPLVESVSSTNVWTEQATPSLTPATYSEFYGISCLTSVTECVAVGTTNESGKDQALAEWLTTSPPWVLGHVAYPTGATSSGLSSVSCITAKVCMGVGNDISSGGVEQALADYIYPTMATLDTPLIPSGAKASHFEGVACTGEPCIAVGDYTTTGGLIAGLSEHN